MSFLDKKKTYTDMQFINLQEPDLSIKDAKKSLIMTSNSMKEFNTGYFKWKHSYRNNYTPEFLKRYGYDTHTKATINKLVKDKTNDYLVDILPDFRESIKNSLYKPNIGIQFFYYMYKTYPLTWFTQAGYFYKDGEQYELTDIYYKATDTIDTSDDEDTIVGTFECISDSDKDDITIEIDNKYKDTTCLVSNYIANTQPEDTDPGEPEDSDDKSITIVATKANVANGEYAMFHIYQDGATDSDEVTANLSIEHICTTDDSFDSKLEYYDVDNDEWKDVTDDLKIPVDDDGDNLINSEDPDNDNTDTDDDGINDGADADVDGDGTNEYDDKDSDGIRDRADSDDDGEDGVDDGKTDEDEDGIVDKYDLDADGDGTNEENTKYNGLLLRVLTKELDEDEKDAILYFNIVIDSSNVNITKDRARGSIYNNAENIVYYLEEQENLPDDLIDTITEDVYMTPIITLKEDGELIQETANSKKMLSKLNISASDFHKTLSDTDDDGEPVIDNAYIITGLSTRNPYIVQAKGYDPKQAEDLPIKLIDMLMKEGLSEGSGADTSYTVTEEIAEKFHKKYMKEEAYLARALFKTFAYYADNFDLSYTDKKLNPHYLGYCVNDIDEQDIVFTSKTAIEQQYTFDIKVETFEGKVRPEEDIKKQGTFSVVEKDNINVYDDWREAFANTFTSNGDVLTIKVQIAENLYQVMTISNYTCTFTISGHRFTLYLRDNKNEHRLVLPYFVLYKLRFNEFVTVYEHSLCLISYAIKTIVVDWYVRFIGVILTIVSCLLGPAGCAVGQLIIDIVVSIVTTIVVEVIMEALQGTVLGLIFQIGLAIFQISGGSWAAFTANFTENFLKLAIQTSQIVGGFVEQKHMQEKAEREALKSSEEQIEERLDNLDGSTLIRPTDKSVEYSFIDSKSPDAIIANMLGASLYNYDQFYGISEVLDRKVNVVSG